MSTALPISVSTRRMAPVTATAGMRQLPFTFPVLRETDVRLLRTRAGGTLELAYGTDFTVWGVNEPDGGTVTLATGALTGDVYVVEGDADLDRLASVASNGRFSSAQIDRDFDLALIRDQELRRDIEDLGQMDVADAVAEAEAAAAAAQAAASSSSGSRLLYATKAMLQVANVVPSVQAVDLAGHLSAGDGGGGLYRRVASAPTHEGKIQSADGAWWEYMPRGNRYSVKAFGAIGDGVADDTAALLNTYNAAIRTKGIVSLPSGTYICSGIDLGGAAHRSAIWEGEAYDGLGNPFLASCIKLRNASNRPIFTVLGGEMAQHIFRYIAFDGNQNQQSANEYIIKAVDDMVTAYPVGIHVQFCHFWYGRGGGIYLGKRRGWNYLENLSFYQCGLGNNGHGIFIDTFDVTMHNIHIGESGGYGLYMLAASQIQAHAVNCYVNQLGGIFIGAGVTDITFTNFSLDRNLRFGLNAVANTNLTYRGLRSFVNGRFLANSTIANGGFPDVMIGAGCDDIAFVGCSFMGDEGANKSAFAIQFADAAGRVRLAACRFAVKSKFSTTEWTNTYACLEGADLPGFADAAVSSVARALNANGAPVLVMSGASGAASHWQMGNDSSINPFLIPRGAAADINAVLRAKGQGVVFIGGGTTSQILASDVGVGFYNTAPVGKPTVTGSRGGNAALASLLSALASMGLITNSSTA